jgi:hypothetical protein
MKRIAPMALMLIACGGEVELSGGYETPGTGGGDVGPEPTIVVSGLEKPRLLRCDSQHLYWNNYDSGDVFQAHIDTPDVYTEFRGAAPHAASAEVRDADVLYLLLAAEQIVRMPKGGGAPTVLANVPQVRGFSVLGEDVYWHTQRDIVGPSGRVLTADDTIRDLAVRDDGLYFATSKTVYSAPLKGVTPSVIAESSSIQAIAVAEDRVIFSTSDSVMSAPEGQGSPEQIGPTTATSIAAAGDVVAWINGSEVYVKRGAEKARLVAQTSGSGGITICGGDVFWASYDDGIVVRAAP